MKTLTPLLLVLTFFLFIPLTAQAQKPDAAKAKKAGTTQVVAETPHLSLAAIATEKGWVRVIVNLNTNFKAEGDLAPAAAADQQFRIKEAQETVLKQLSSENIVVNQRFDYVPDLALSVTAKGLAELEAMPEVSSVVEDKMNKVLLDESTSRIGANRAWYGGGFTGAGWTVAVLDSGFDTSHAFLAGKIVSEACYSTTYIQGAPVGAVQSLCPNGQASQTGTGASRNCTGVDGCEHGTHVAGIVAGKNSQFSGVAPDANLITIQVFTRINNQTFCGGASSCIVSYDSNMISGLERVYALRNNFKIASVNMSLAGGRYTQPCDSQNRATKAAIDNLRSVGIATVIASGNDSYSDSISSPACITTAVSVGATTSDDGISDFSNDAYFLSLLAPGSQIYSSIPGGGYESLDGTSMAAPHVAGAWAIRKQYQPAAGVTDLLAYFKRTGLAVTNGISGNTFRRIQVDQEMPLADMATTMSINKSEIALGDTVIASFQIKNTGSYPLTLSSIFSGLTFSPNPLPIGQTATAQIQHTISLSDLPGPYQVGDLVLGENGKASTADFVSGSVNLAAITVQGKVNQGIVDVGDEVSYYYEATNAGNVDVTLSVNSPRFSSPIIGNKTLVKGATTEINGYYTTRATDLPGPLTNDTTIIGTSDKGTATKVTVSNLLVNLIELINIDPRADTTQTINTTQNIVTMEFPPQSLSTFAQQLAYVKLGNPLRLPAISAGLVFDSAFKTGTSYITETALPVIVTIHYQDTQLPANVPEAELAVYSYDTTTQQWVLLPSVVVDTNANTVSFTTSELGQYALTGHPYTNFLYLPVIKR